MKNILANRKGQGTTEYIVILAIAMVIAVTIFWPQIKGILEKKVSTISSQIQNAGN